MGKFISQLFGIVIYGLAGWSFFSGEYEKATALASMGCLFFLGQIHLDQKDD